MLITGIKSKPVYAPLRFDVGGRYHLMLGLGPGCVTLERILDEARAAAEASVQQRTRVLYVPLSAQLTSSQIDETPISTRFAGMQFAAMRRFANANLLLGMFREILEESLMGTRLYVAGPESFIGLAMKIALEFNLNQDEIRAEELGSLARRVHCVHCRATTEEVGTNVVRCTGCDRWLLVRDHYSRRLAAYMGVMADAEEPGVLPPIQQVYV